MNLSKSDQGQCRSASYAIGRFHCISAVWVIALIMSPAGCATQSPTDVDTFIQSTTDRDRLALVSFTAEWCAPCHHMEQTTWADPSVRDWIEQHADRILIDIDEEPSVAESYEVTGVPVVLAFRDGEHVDRLFGNEDASSLLQWMEAVREGRRRVDLIHGDVERLSDAGPHKQADNRFALFHELVHLEEWSGAAEQAVWLWDHRAYIERALPWQCFQTLVANHEATHAKVKAWRGEIKIDSPETTDDEHADWLFLSNVLSDSKSLADWVEFQNDRELRARQSLVGSFWGPLVDAAIEHQRWDAVLRLYECDGTDALTKIRKAVSNLADAAILDEHGHPTGTRVRLAEIPMVAERYRSRHAALHTALLLAERDEDARTVAELTLDVLTDSETRDAFAVAAKRAAELSMQDQ